MGRGRRQSALLDDQKEFARTSGDTFEGAEEIRSSRVVGRITRRAKTALEKAGWSLSDISSMIPEISDLSFSLNVTSPSLGVVQIKALIQGEGGSIEGSFRRTLDLDEKIAYHNSFQIRDPAKQGQGIGIRTFLAALEQYRKHGITSIELYANSEVGGYFWARVGFQLSSPEAGLVVRKRAERALQNLQELRLSLGEEGRELSVDVAYLEEMLAEETLPVHKLAAFKPGAKDLLQRLRRIKGGLSEGAQEIAEALEGGMLSGKNLLLGSGWSGTFSLQDGPSEKILADYLNHLQKNENKSS